MSKRKSKHLVATILLTLILIISNTMLVFGVETAKSDEGENVTYPYTLVDDEYVKIEVLGKGANPYNDSWIGYKLCLTNKQDYSISFSSTAEIIEGQQLGGGDTCYYNGTLTKTHFGEVINPGIVYEKAVLAVDGVTEESQLQNVKGYIRVRNNSTGDVLGNHAYAFDMTEAAETEVETETVKETVKETETEEAGIDFKLDFSAEDTLEMSRWMNYGRYIYRDGELYGWYKENDTSSLLVVTPETDGYHMDLKNGKMIYEALVKYLCQDEKYIYGVWTSNEDAEKGGIVRIDPGTKTAESIYDQPVDCLQCVDGKLYFTDKDAHLMSADTEMKKITPIIDEKEVYFPYVLKNGWVLFQDDADGESLHLREMANKEEMRISETGYRVYNYIIAGDKIYMTPLTADDTVYLGYIDMKTWENTFSEQTYKYSDLFIDGDHIFVYRAFGHLADLNNLTKISDDVEFTYKFLANDKIIVYRGENSWVRVCPHYNLDDSVGGESVSFAIH